jgi:ribosomal protein S27E
MPGGALLQAQGGATGTEAAGEETAAHADTPRLRRCSAPDAATAALSFVPNNAPPARFHSGGRSLQLQRLASGGAPSPLADTDESQADALLRVRCQTFVSTQIVLSNAVRGTSAACCGRALQESLTAARAS